MFGPGIAINASAARANSASVDGAGRPAANTTAGSDETRGCVSSLGDDVRPPRLRRSCIVGRLYTREGMPARAAATSPRWATLLDRRRAGGAGWAQAGCGGGAAGDRPTPSTGAPRRRPRRSRCGSISRPMAARTRSKQAVYGRSRRPAARHTGSSCTPDQFRAKYALTDATVKAVKLWLKAEGLTGHGRSRRPAATSPRAATAAAAEAAFAVTLHDFTKGADTFQAPTATPTVPDAIAADVLAVSGLVDRRRGDEAAAAVVSTPAGVRERAPVLGHLRLDPGQVPGRLQDRAAEVQRKSHTATTRSAATAGKQLRAAYGGGKYTGRA